LTPQTSCKRFFVEVAFAAKNKLDFVEVNARIVADFDSNAPVWWKRQLLNMVTLIILKCVIEMDSA